MSNASAAAPPAEPAWVGQFKKFQLTVVLIGLLLNILGLAVFYAKRSAKSYSVITLMVLKHQSIIDSLICLMTVFYLLPGLPDSSSSGAACYLWYSQTFYWILVVLSVWNLLLICVERFMAVVFPLRYRAKRPVHAVCMIAGIHLWACLLAAPVTFWVRHADGTCSYGTPTFDSKVLLDFLTVHAAVWFVGIYLLPSVCMAAMYTKIVLVIRTKTSGNTDGGPSQNRAAAEFTKTAIVVTSVFIVTFSFDSFYYFIGTFSPAIQYEVNSPLQIFGTFMVTLNSCANVIVYLIFMRSFRKQALWLLTCGRRTDTSVGAATSGSV